MLSMVIGTRCDSRHHPGFHCLATLFVTVLFNLISIASQVWLLVRLLPIIIGTEVSNDNEWWANFVLQLDIADFLLAPESSEDEASLLSTMMSDHHEEFIRIYPSASITLKFHYLVHMPRLTSE